MSFMTEETFGPCVGIMKVKDENEAIKLMNDSPYGLTASIWTKDMGVAEKIGNQIQTETGNGGIIKILIYLTAPTSRLFTNNQLFSSLYQ